MNNIYTDWPPLYTVRNSARAKQVILQISPKEGLVIIVPVRKRHHNIEEVLLQKRGWIQKNLSKLQERPQILPGPFEPPTELQLHAIQKQLKIQYEKTDNKYLKIKRLEPLSYQFRGSVDQPLLVIKALQTLIKKIAQHYLIPWLENLSLETGFPFSSVKIRKQSTLWGSCTASKKISLNVKLLFLPQELTRYVLLHELCHTQHLNHSKRYWNLLKKFDPNCLVHKRMLRSAEQYLPGWIEE